MSETSGDGWHDFTSRDLGIPGSTAILIDHDPHSDSTPNNDAFQDSR